AHDLLPTLTMLIAAPTVDEWPHKMGQFVSQRGRQLLRVFFKQPEIKFDTIFIHKRTPKRCTHARIEIYARAGNKLRLVVGEIRRQSRTVVGKQSLRLLY